MKNTTALKLDEAIANAEEYIKQMEQMDDKKLAKHIDLFRQQKEIAIKQKNEAAYKLLLQYERQTIEARIKKNFTNKK